MNQLILLAIKVPKSGIARYVGLMLHNGTLSNICAFACVFALVCSTIAYAVVRKMNKDRAASQYEIQERIEGNEP